MDLFGVPYVPHNIILDHNMTVRHSAYGFNENEMIAIIEELMGEIPEVGVNFEEKQSIVPERIILNSPYPNPFNHQTRISFYLPINAEVELSVFDLLGAQLTILRKREKVPAGYHQLIWNAEGLSSGIYFVVLESPSQRQTEKVILLK